MCFGGQPKIPAIPAPPPPVTLDEARGAIGARDRRRKAAMSGSQSTFLTGPGGAKPPYSAKSLLGQ